MPEAINQDNVVQYVADKLREQVDAGRLKSSRGSDTTVGAFCNISGDGTSRHYYHGEKVFVNAKTLLCYYHGNAELQNPNENSQNNVYVEWGICRTFRLPDLSLLKPTELDLFQVQGLPSEFYFRARFNVSFSGAGPDRYSITLKSDDFSTVSNVNVKGSKSEEDAKSDQRYSNIKNGQSLQESIDTVVQNLVTPFLQKK